MLIPFLSSLLSAVLTLAVSASDASGITGESKGMQMLVVTCTGLIVVFLVLIILIMVFKLFGLFGKDKKKSLPSSGAKKSLDSGDVRLAVGPGVDPAALPPASGISEEVIAAISAAVAVTLEGKPFAIRRVQRAQTGGRNAWANAGVLESTRPF